MKQKDIICDSGIFISLTSSCLIDLLYYFSKKYHVRFIIPPAVEEEMILYPINKKVKRYLFSAIRIQDAVNDGVITKIEKKETNSEADRIMNYANNLFYMRGKPIKLIQKGEAETIALAIELGVDNLLVDERTTRLLIEAPFSIKKHLEHEFKINVMVNRKNMNELSGKISNLNVIRSSELVSVAYENGYFNKYQNMRKNSFEAALYKIKFSGCSIGFDEIREYLKRVK